MRRADTNECLGVALTLDRCNCERCVCHNLSPGFQCETMPDGCASEGSHTCWVSGDGHTSACMDTIDQMKAAGLHSKDPHSIRPYNCTCPEGYKGDGTKAGNGCVSACPTLPLSCPPSARGKLPTARGAARRTIYSAASARGVHRQSQHSVTHSKCWGHLVLG